jgi:DNA-binding transcriptional LysR family regulator
MHENGTRLAEREECNTLVLVDWSTLAEFLTIADEGSISRAAASLGVSQPALSRRLLALEESLDLSLFVRSQRGLILTAAGERVRSLAERMRETATAIESAAQLGQDRVSGVVRISAPEARLGTDWLPRVLLPLRSEHPELSFEIVIENRIADLERRAVDIAIRAAEPKGDQLTARRVAKIGWGLFASKSYLGVKSPPRERAELHQHDFVVYEQARDRRQNTWLDERGLGDRLVLLTSNVETSFNAICAGWGIGMMPLIVGAADPRLVRILPDSERISMAIWLVTHAELKKSPKIRAVFSHLARCFERDKERFLSRG